MSDETSTSQPRNLAEELAEALWAESKFPSGGARTSLAKCRLIVNTAIAKVLNQTGS